MKSGNRLLRLFGLCALGWAAILNGGCVRIGAASQANGDKPTIQNIGSDTMVNIAQAWAEEYSRVEPAISVEVSGGGTGTGVAAMINGTADIANCSRSLDQDETARVRASTGQEPLRYVVGYDALAIFVNQANPLNVISIDKLAAIYGEHGAILSWKDLGIEVPGCPSGKMILVSRQSNSGTYFYFRDAVLGRKGDFKLGTLDLHGSKEVVELVNRTPCAIGYSGMGYAMPGVKMLAVARREGEPAFEPTIDNTQSGAYPISRPLYMYTIGRPRAVVARYLDWIGSRDGQKLVVSAGYVPLKGVLVQHGIAEKGDH